MIDLSAFKDRIVAVMGLGRTGLSAARALRNGGAQVWVWDDAPTGREAARTNGFEPVDLTKADLARAALMIWSPGIAHTHPKPHPVAEAARRVRLEMVCDIELLIRARSAAAYVGITGTNGKSTTTALTGHILRRAGRKTEVGGNLGMPVLELAPLGVDGVYVLELSSYQLELTPSLACDVAVLLNISPDHLARHGGMDGYIAAKKQIFTGQGGKDCAVIGIDDDASRAIFQNLQSEGHRKMVSVSVSKKLENGIYVDNGKLIDAIDGAHRQVADLKTIATLPGSHNWQNAAAAYAVARALNIPESEIVAGLASYPGLAHRQELVGRLGAIAYVNDSKATNADAAEKALVCYDTIYWIAGGQAKEGGITALAPLFGRIRHAFLIGEAAEDFAAALQGKVVFTLCGDLATALEKAHAQAQAENIQDAVVLLSPACASWDQFKSFEDRGDRFREKAQALISAHSERRAGP